MKLFSLVILIFSLSFNIKAQTTTGVEVVVTVKNVKSTEGMITVTLFNSKENFLEKAYQSQTKSANDKEYTFVFKNVTKGTYTAYAMHDKNGNDKLDMNVFGIPNEPYGVSKQGKNRFGPPIYDKAIFEIEQANINMNIRVD